MFLRSVLEDYRVALFDAVIFFAVWSALDGFRAVNKVVQDWYVFRV
eukprot:SAG31_NODE_2909_length_4921_cov_6.411240_1_plen_46_part_00